MATYSISIPGHSFSYVTNDNAQIAAETTRHI